MWESTAKLMPKKTFILVPGYGATGGEKALIWCISSMGMDLVAIVNSSRRNHCWHTNGDIQEFGELNYGDASRKAVEVMIEDISGA